MKNLLCVVLLAVLGRDVMAQNKKPIIAGYACLRESTPGVSPKGAIDEKGNEAKRAKHSAGSYYVYVEYKKNQMIQPFRVWLYGKPYHVKNQKISHTPVIIQQQATGISAQADTVVAKTINGVMQIIPDGEWINKKPAAAATSENTLIEYYWKGKRYTYTIKEIKKLSPAVLQ